MQLAVRGAPELRCGELCRSTFKGPPPNFGEKGKPTLWDDLTAVEDCVGRTRSCREKAENVDPPSLRAVGYFVKKDPLNPVGDAIALDVSGNVADGPSKPIGRDVTKDLRARPFEIGNEHPVAVVLSGPRPIRRVHDHSRRGEGAQCRPVGSLPRTEISRNKGFVGTGDGGLVHGNLEAERAGPVGHRRDDLEPEAGFEPATCSLRVSCSTPELPGRGEVNTIAGPYRPPAQDKRQLATSRAGPCRPPAQDKREQLASHAEPRRLRTKGWEPKQQRLQEQRQVRVPFEMFVRRLQGFDGSERSNQLIVVVRGWFG